MNGENSNIERIRNLSKTVETISKVTMIFCIVMDVIIAVAGSFIIAFKDTLNSMLQQGIDEGALIVSEIPSSNFLSKDLLLTGDYAVHIFAALMEMLVSVLVLTVIMYFVGRTFKVFRESYSPFMPSVLKQLKVIFIMIVIISLRNSLLIGAIIGFALWSFYRMFEYGCELQKQSDETL